MRQKREISPSKCSNSSTLVIFYSLAKTFLLIKSRYFFLLVCSSFLILIMDLAVIYLSLMFFKLFMSIDFMVFWISFLPLKELSIMVWIKYSWCWSTYCSWLAKVNFYHCSSLFHSRSNSSLTAYFSRWYWLILASLTTRLFSSRMS